MRKLKILFIALIPCFLFSIFACQPKIEPSFASSSGRAMCVLEKDSKRVIYSKNMNEQLPMASTTKVVTAITVLQHCSNLDEYIQVDDSSIGVEGTSIYLRQGETIKVKDLLYGLMLRSGILPIHISETVLSDNKAREHTTTINSE